MIVLVFALILVAGVLMAYFKGWTDGMEESPYKQRWIEANRILQKAIESGEVKEVKRQAAGVTMPSRVSELSRLDELFKPPRATGAPSKTKGGVPPPLLPGYGSWHVEQRADEGGVDIYVVKGRERIHQTRVGVDRATSRKPHLTFAQSIRQAMDAAQEAAEALNR